jgi:Domain of unknown function (DUF4190)
MTSHVFRRIESDKIGQKIGAIRGRSSCPVFGFWLLGTIPAIVFGHMARNQIRQRNEQGAGLALAGLILGYVGVGLSVILVIIIIAAVRSSQSTGY